MRIAKKTNGYKLQNTMTLYKQPELSNSFIVLMALDESNQPQSSTQISEIISSKSNGKIFKVSGTIKDS